MALSSTEPADFPLPRTALELGFDLVALRAPCMRERTGTAGAVQAAAGPEVCNLREVSLAALGAAVSSTIAAMHLRMPSIDQGAQAFAWAVFFFLLLWVGMLAVGVSGATAFILALVAGGAIFLFVRIAGDDTPGRSA